jgi:hypothetical protein
MDDQLHAINLAKADVTLHDNSGQLLTDVPYPQVHETSPILKDLHVAILKALDQAHPRGLNQDDIAVLVHRTRGSVSPKLKELYLWGLARKDSERGPSVITKAGRKALAKLQDPT